MKFPEVHPAVVGTITTSAGLRLLAQKQAADAIEVRVDALLAVEVPVEKIVAALQTRKTPVLLTLRIPAEGGQRGWRVKERRELYLKLLPHVEAIDVELATAHAMRPAIEEARRAGKTVVLSAHAIAKAAPAAQIARWVAQFDAKPGTILKIAARIQGWRDLQQLAALLVNHPDWPVAVMGLGPYAGQSRSVLAALGSRLVYGYLDKPAAPGQPSAAEVKKMVLTVRNFSANA
jgi:3-dehydroquinate dehydratase-1